MKTSSNRIFGISFVLAAMLISTSSFAALNAYLKLKGSNGKTYKTTADASGKFSFSNVEPGNYKLVWVLPPGEGSPTGDCEIHIESFSWGATNTGGTIDAPLSTDAQGKSTPATRSNISNNRSSGGGTEVSPEPVEMQGKSTPVTRSNISNNRSSGGGTGKVQLQDFHFKTNASKLSKDGDEYYTVVFEDILISSYTAPSGNVGGLQCTYDLKKSVK